MLAIKEIGRIARIDLAGHKAFFGGELGISPFPHPSIVAMQNLSVGIFARVDGTVQSAWLGKLLTRLTG
jgi:hypothetical protein